MTDIVERLRAPRSRLVARDALHHEAAADLAALRAERDRLRGALVEIGNTPSGLYLTYVAFVATVKGIAARALTTEGGRHEHGRWRPTDQPRT